MSFVRFSIIRVRSVLLSTGMEKLAKSETAITAAINLHAELCVGSRRRWEHEAFSSQGMRGRKYQTKVSSLIVIATAEEVITRCAGAGYAIFLSAFFGQKINFRV